MDKYRLYGFWIDEWTKKELPRDWKKQINAGYEFHVKAERGNF